MKLTLDANLTCKSCGNKAGFELSDDEIPMDAVEKMIESIGWSTCHVCGDEFCHNCPLEVVCDDDLYCEDCLHDTR